MSVINLKGVQFDHRVTNNEILESTLKTDFLLENLNENFNKESLDIKSGINEILSIVSEFSAQPATMGKKMYTSSRDEVNATVKMLLNKLSLKITDIEDEFENIHDRIYNFGVIFKILDELIDNLDEMKISEKYLMRCCIVIHDIIKKVKSENLNESHLEVIKYGLLIIIGGKVSREKFNELDNKLLDYGLDWVYGG